VYKRTDLLQAVNPKLRIREFTGIGNMAIEISRDIPKMIDYSDHGLAYVLFSVVNNAASQKRKDFSHLTSVKRNTKKSGSWKSEGSKFWVAKFIYDAFQLTLASPTRFQATCLH